MLKSIWGGGWSAEGWVTQYEHINRPLSASLLLITVPDAPVLFIQLRIEVITPRIHSTVYELTM